MRLLLLQWTLNSNEESIVNNSSVRQRINRVWCDWAETGKLCWFVLTNSLFTHHLCCFSEAMLQSVSCGREPGVAIRPKVFAIWCCSKSLQISVMEWHWVVISDWGIWEHSAWMTFKLVADKKESGWRRWRAREAKGEAGMQPRR